MTEAKCRHIDEEGVCHGLYDGFGCIGDICKDSTAGPSSSKCGHMRGDGYCKKFGKFHCLGEEECEEFGET